MDPFEKSLWLAILLGVFLRLNQFWKPSLWVDELSTVWVASADGWSTLWQRCLLAHQPPAYYLIVKAFLALGRNEFCIRLPSVIFGLASLGMLMIIMRRMVGMRGALYAGAIYALNSRAIYHSQEARMYALVLFTTMCSIYFCIGWLENGGRWRLAVYAASTLLVAYSHIIYSALLFGQIAVTIWFYFFNKNRSPALRRLLGIQMLLLLLLLPLTTLFLSIVGHSQAGIGSFIARPDLLYFTELLEYPEFSAALFLVLLAVPKVWRERERWCALTLGEKWLVGIGLAYLAIFPATVVLARAGVANILIARYLLLPVLGAIIVAAFVVAKAQDRSIRATVYTYVCVLALLQAIGARYVGIPVSASQHDWRGAIRWIQEHYRPGDIVLLRSGLIEAKYLSLQDHGAQEYLALPLCGFYDRGGMTIFNLPWTAEQLYTSGLTPAAVRERVQGARQVFVVAGSVLSNNWDWTLQSRWIEGPRQPPRRVEKHSFQLLQVRVYLLP